MKKIKSYKEIIKHIGIENLNELNLISSSFKNEVRQERLNKLSEKKYTYKAEMGIYTVSNKKILIIKPKGEKCIRIPLKG